MIIKLVVEWEVIIYKGKVELVLVSSSKLYPEFESIFVGISGPSFYSILYYLLTILTTDYYLNEYINNSVLKRMFYSKYKSVQVTTKHHTIKCIFRKEPMLGSNFLL